MLNFHEDQAEGLRRLMAAPKPRVLSILSASANQQPLRLITNLATSMTAQGNHVLVVEATGNSEEMQHAVNHLPALLDVAYGKALLTDAITETNLGFSCAKLKNNYQINTLADAYENQQLGFIFEELTYEFDVVFINATLDQQNMLPLTMLNEGEILIQLSRKPQSIKHAYGLIKRICNQIGSRSFSIVVDDATEEQAMPIFNNLAEVAWRFMKIQLTFFGAIPTDEHLTRAAYMGRAVVDAFPTANASNAFHKIASRLHKKPKKSHALPISSII